MGGGTIGAGTTSLITNPTTSITGAITNNGLLLFQQNGLTITDAFVISGTGSVTQGGTGTTTLSGNNTYTGGTTVNAGSLVLSGNLANNTSNMLTINNGGTAVFTVSDVFINADNPVYTPVTVNAGGTLINSNGYNSIAALYLNGGTLNAAGGANGLSFALRGNVAVNGGTNTSVITGSYGGVNLGGYDLTGTTFNVASGGTASGIDLLVSTALVNGTIRGSWPNQQASYLTKTGAGTMLLSGNNTYSGTTTISAGTLIVGDGTTNGTLGSGNVTDNASMVFNRSDARSYSMVISGTGSVTQGGTGMTTLSGNNTYTGGTTVNAGSLVLSGNLANNTSNMLTINSGGTAVFSVSDVFINADNPVYTPVTVNAGGDAHQFQRLQLHRRSLPQRGHSQCCGRGQRTLLCPSWQCLGQWWN